jgi:shikimate kinase
MDNINFKLNEQTIDNIHVYAKLLNKDINTILNEALEDYFMAQEKKLMEKNIADESALTNLDYDEFWDGLDID